MKKKSKKPKVDKDLAVQAAEMLCDAYDRGEADGGEMDWSDVDQAYAVALRALGRKS